MLLNKFKKKPSWQQRSQSRNRIGVRRAHEKFLQLIKKNPHIIKEYDRKKLTQLMLWPSKVN